MDPAIVSAPLPHEVWIDRGGTFTDCIGRDPRTGETRVVKVLSEDRAPLVGIRRLLDLGDDAPIPPCDVRMGTTLATNALLERRGEPTLLVVDRGFAHLLRIGDQRRPDLFALDIRRPPPLTEELLEIAARLAADGSVVVPLDRDEVRRALAERRARGLRTVAIALLHGYRHPAIEREVAAIATEVGFEHVLASSEASPEIGLLARAGTTLADAYLTPPLHRYVASLLAELPGSRVRVMQSSGALLDAKRLRGRDAVLSGPAGGAIAVATLAARHGFSEAIGFDMGGTSTDVCRVGTEGFERRLETEVAGVRIRSPMIAIHTVAAGGGSICREEGGRLRVGPESAGARPGPLCYGASDAVDLALADCALALGRLPTRRFPFALDRAAVDRALAHAVGELGGEPDDELARCRLAEGFVEIAVEKMAAAIREVTIARGHDVREHALVVFGGAGGQLAGLVARKLGVKRLLVPPYASVLSAYGMGCAPIGWHGERDAGAVPLSGEVLERARGLFNALEREGLAVLAEDGARGMPRAARHADLRYVGAEQSLRVPVPEEHAPAAWERAFADVHRREFGYVREARGIELVAVHLALDAWPSPPVGSAQPAQRAADRSRTARLFVGGCYEHARDVDREELAPGDLLEGPAFLVDDTSSIVVEPGFRARMTDDGSILLEDLAPAVETASAGDDASPDPVRVEVFRHLFMSVAEQMGAVLQRTALSTNIRDRLDFSCALFDREGNLIANAPHIPVHLGAMGESVRAVREAHPRPDPGDVFVTNDPARGGSHLPDITVVTPIHDERGDVRMVVASRGHHADVGGTTPGSMPPDSRTLADEGVVLRCLPLVRRGVLDDGPVRRAFAEATHPPRRPDDNVADLVAQVAANARGVEAVRELVARHGRARVEAYLGHVQDHAALLVEEAIEGLSDGDFAFEDALDDGTPIRVRIEVQGCRMTIDFAGTSPAVDGNLNAPRAVTLACVLYVLRSLVGKPIPLNAGCARPVSLVIPDGSILNPEPFRAVVGGNVETSQRVVDVLLGALGLAAASQGTMNNVTFGDDTFGYYETLGGGAGAGDGFDGASGVHTHMTNSRITDAEILESRYPVRLWRFELRRGSGGRGRFRGGDGLVREIELLRPLQVSLLTERRVRAPFGLLGGEPGAKGRNLLDGVELPSRATVHAPAGARLVIETPGGGGYGREGS